MVEEWGVLAFQWSEESEQRKRGGWLWPGDGPSQAPRGRWPLVTGSQHCGPALPCPFPVSGGSWLAGPGSRGPSTAPRSVHERGWWAGGMQMTGVVAGEESGGRGPGGWSQGRCPVWPQRSVPVWPGGVLSISIEPGHLGDDKPCLLGLRSVLDRFEGHWELKIKAVPELASTVVI